MDYFSQYKRPPICSIQNSITDSFQPVRHISSCIGYLSLINRKSICYNRCIRLQIFYMAGQFRPCILILFPRCILNQFSSVCRIYHGSPDRKQIPAGFPLNHICHCTKTTYCFPVHHGIAGGRNRIHTAVFCR